MGCIKGVAYHQKKERPQLYTKADMVEWRRLMRENNWKQYELAAHLKLSQDVVGAWLRKDTLGEIRN